MSRLTDLMKGNQNSCDGCPLARAIRLGEGEVEVGPDGIDLWDSNDAEIERIAQAIGSVNATEATNCHRVRLSPVLLKFIAGFDGGRYPELIDGYEVFDG